MKQAKAPKEISVETSGGGRRLLGGPAVPKAARGVAVRTGSGVAGGGGRGVFATRRIEAGTVIETAPLLVLSAEETRYAEERGGRWQIWRYAVGLPEAGVWAIMLGVVSLCNHGWEGPVPEEHRSGGGGVEVRGKANADLVVNEEAKVVTLRAKKGGDSIGKGEEILFDYKLASEDREAMFSGG